MPTTWLCKKCQTLNRQSDTSCDECFTERDSGKDEHGEEERVIDLSKIPKHNMFYYLVSQHTSRIFLHDEVCLYLSGTREVIWIQYHTHFYWHFFYTGLCDIWNLRIDGCVSIDSNSMSFVLYTYCNMYVAADSLEIVDNLYKCCIYINLII